MNVLLVTGRLAEEQVRMQAGDADVADVYVADVDVAAFITPSHIRHLRLEKYDLVIVPGLTKGARWRELEEEKGVKIRLGPTHAYDIPTVLRHLDSIELRHDVPADKLIARQKLKETMELVDGIESYDFMIGSVKVGRGSRMKVVAEVVDATRLSEDELRSKISHYLESGADIIDIGVPMEFEVSEVRRAVKIAADMHDAVSVDTFSKKAIRAGVEAGADMVMSISAENLDALDAVKGKAVVIVSRDINQLLTIAEKAERYTDRIILDAVLDAFPGITSSILRYAELARRSERPVLFGVGNVTELSDADSIGMNALLAFMAEELGASLLFTTEASPKTFGSVKELKIASYMAKAAKLRRTPPKDLGMNLLVVKEKVRFEVCDEFEGCLEGEESKRFVRDPSGDFRIWVRNGEIICSHEKLCVKGRTAKAIYDTVIARGLVSRLEHAAYLGRELMKAEIAAKLNKNYIQDEPLGFGIYDGER